MTAHILIYISVCAGTRYYWYCSGKKSRRKPDWFVNIIFFFFAAPSKTQLCSKPFPQVNSHTKGLECVLGSNSLLLFFFVLLIAFDTLWRQCFSHSIYTRYVTLGPPNNISIPKWLLMIVLRRRGGEQREQSRAACGGKAKQTNSKRTKLLWKQNKKWPSHGRKVSYKICRRAYNKSHWIQPSERAENNLSVSSEWLSIHHRNWYCFLKVSLFFAFHCCTLKLSSSSLWKLETINKH